MSLKCVMQNIGFLCGYTLLPLIKDHDSVEGVLQTNWHGSRKNVYKKEMENLGEMGRTGYLWIVGPKGGAMETTPMYPSLTIISNYQSIWTTIQNGLSSSDSSFISKFSISL